MSVKYALISVSDKNSVDFLARAILAQNYSIISTGGTYNYIYDRIPEPDRVRLIQVSDFTGFPEILGGRVKTLHPKIYGSLLARRDLDEHLNELRTLSIPLIDIVVVNLYPFHLASTPNRAAKNDNNTDNMNEALELIDIGGVTLIRAAAKNWKSVLVVTDRTDYSEIISMNIAELLLNSNDTYRQRLAAKAYAHTANYDLEIANYMYSDLNSKNDGENNENNNENKGENRLTARLYSDRRMMLKYGCNPQQKTAFAVSIIGNSPRLPFRVLNGRDSLGYINLLDALNGWQLVSELQRVLNEPAAASFKHTSPAGAAIYRPISQKLLQVYGGGVVVNKDKGTGGTGELSPLAIAFLRAREGDPKSSFGDFIALSDVCDFSTAQLIQREVSDGVIAPGYTNEALSLLQAKKGNKYIVLQMDPFYQPSDLMEYRELFGVALVQDRNLAVVDHSVFGEEKNTPTKNKVPVEAQTDLLLANITLKYAQSNNVVFAKDGAVIGIAAGQQSRVDAVKLAGNKACIWYLRQHPKAMALWSKFRKDVPVKRQDKINAIIRYIEGNFTDVEYDYWKTHFEPAIPELLTDDEKREFLLSLDKVSLASDAFFPFRDNIDQAARFGVEYIIQPGGSLADAGVIKACDQYDIAMTLTAQRMFTH